MIVAFQTRLTPVVAVYTTALVKCAIQWRRIIIDTIMERQSTGFQAHPPSLLPPTNHYSLASQESASSSRPSPPAQPLTARYVISNTQWEDLKPLIKQLYIEENRTFKSTAAILSDNYGFNPTKRQFSARVLRWGFRKNALLTEKLALVHRSTGPKGSKDPKGPESGVKGKRWQRSTVTRWEREFQSSIQQSQAGDATYNISSSLRMCLASTINLHSSANLPFYR